MKIVFWSIKILRFRNPFNSFIEHYLQIWNLELIYVVSPTEEIKNNKVNFIRVEIKLCGDNGFFHNLFGYLFFRALFCLHILLNKGVKFVHKFSSFLHQMYFFFFIVNSNISDQFRKHWPNNRHSLWSVHILHKIPLTSILNTISCEKFSIMIILNLKRILFENVDNFLNGQLFIIIFKNTFK